MQVCATLSAAALSVLGLSPAGAEEAAGPTAMVEDPCAGVVDHPFDASFRPMLEPGAHFTPPPADPAAAKAMADQRARDWANLCRYRAADKAQAAAAKAVFMGDSITELWAIADPALFSSGVVGRGISGQTSPQMLLRFQADVVALHPRVVHILAGTNDIAGNTGPTSEEDFERNVASMVEIAQAHGIRVLLGSIPPMASLGWQPQYRPAGEVRRLNSWLQAYAARSGATYVDYYSRLATPDGAFRPELSNDGVHPNLVGYAIMREVAERAIGAAAP